jgi:hypothetical protein
MKDKFTKNSEEEHYTIVYFDVMKDLQIGFTEYAVLQTMFHFSKRNVCNIEKSNLSRKLFIARNTLNKYLEKLIFKEHISKVETDSKTYYLKYDVKERFENGGKIYVKIYHKHRKELKISIKHYIFLYMIYALSKNKVSRISLASKEYYSEYINTSISNFGTIKCELTKKGFLERQETGFLKLNENIFNWFENNKSVQK